MVIGYIRLFFLVVRRIDDNVRINAVTSSMWRRCSSQCTSFHQLVSTVNMKHQWYMRYHKALFPYKGKHRVTINWKNMWSSKVEYLHDEPISAQCSHFIPTGVFRGYKMETLAKNGLIKYFCMSVLFLLNCSCLRS